MLNASIAITIIVYGISALLLPADAGMLTSPASFLPIFTLTYICLRHCVHRRYLSFNKINQVAFYCGHLLIAAAFLFMRLSIADGANPIGAAMVAVCIFILAFFAYSCGVIAIFLFAKRSAKS
nr:hypothetical protein [uncultured Undibacterium sp.]